MSRLGHRQVMGYASVRLLREVEAQLWSSSRGRVHHQQPISVSNSRCRVQRQQLCYYQQHQWHLVHVWIATEPLSSRGRIRRHTVSWVWARSLPTGIATGADRWPGLMAPALHVVLSLQGAWLASRSPMWHRC